MGQKEERLMKEDRHRRKEGSFRQHGEGSAKTNELRHLAGRKNKSVMFTTFHELVFQRISPPTLCPNQPHPLLYTKRHHP